MASVSSVYRDLDDTAGEIRLITLQPAPSRNLRIHPISCQISYTTLSDPSSYEALSYTWGRDISPDCLLLNGKEFLVTINLEASLLYLRLPDKPRTLWIDALCINQNNIPERNTQVPKMQQIYGNAERVVVWLSLHYNDSKLAMTLLSELASEDLSEDSPTAEDTVIEFLSDPTRSQSWEACGKICDRGYWQRVWIWQEVVCAKEAILVLGEDSVSWNTFGNLATTLLSVRSRSPEIRDIFRKVKIEKKFGAIAMLRLQRKRWLLGKPLNLWGYLVNNHSRRCTDERDRIYGFVSIAKNCQDGSFTVDYNRSVGQVYLDAALHIIKESRTLAVIYDVGFQDPQHNLPSWVPDWSRGIRDATLFKTSKLYGTWHADFPDKGVTVAEFKEAEGFRVMTVTGITLGILDTVVDRCYEVENSSGGTFTSHLCRNFKIWAQLAVENISSGKLLNYGNDPKKGIMEALWRAIILNEPHSIEDEQATRIMFNVLRGAATLPASDEVESGKSYEERLDEYAALLINIARGTLMHRTIFLSGQSLMGLCTTAARAGDLVCVLQGGPIPVILRRVDDHFIYVGQAYVHGFMSGQVLRHLEEGTLKKEKFSLH
jgi:hypothetical protein